MKTYFNSIGFKNILTKTQLKSLKDDVIEFPTERYFSSVADGNNYIEYYKRYSDNVGVSIKGTIDDFDKITISAFIPYAKSDRYINADFINIEKSENGKEYYVVCEDLETNNEITFYLQNAYAYLKVEDMHMGNFKKVSIAGLSRIGKVILPVKKDIDTIQFDYKEEQERKEIIKRAKRGDDDAVEQLRTEAEENAEIIRSRLKEEDFLSVIESYMVPIEDTEASYSILGTIIDIEKLTNQKTNEEIYKILADITGTKMDIFINSEDLTGYPLIGMRFMGEGCFQGFIY